MRLVYTLKVTKCGTCMERIEALSEAGIEDTTIYESEELKA